MELSERFGAGLRNRGHGLASDLLVYFVAVGLVCTGLASWALRHWREFAGESASAV